MSRKKQTIGSADEHFSAAVSEQQAAARRLWSMIQAVAIAADDSENRTMEDPGSALEVIEEMAYALFSALDTTVLAQRAKEIAADREAMAE